MQGTETNLDERGGNRQTKDVTIYDKAIKFDLVWKRTFSPLIECLYTYSNLVTMIFKSGELIEDSVTEKISATAADGKNYLATYYNLDAIISGGYRVNSICAMQFRQGMMQQLLTGTIRLENASTVH